MDKKSLVKYLKTTVMLEQKVYEQESIINALENRINDLKNNSYLERPLDRPSAPMKESIGEFILGSIMISPIVMLLMGLFDGFMPLSIAIGIIYVAFVIGAIANTIKENREAEDAYYRKLEEVKKANSIIKAENSQITANIQREIRILQSDKQSLLSLYNKTKKSLSNHYENNIIYSKYRNFICITSILDYLLSGVCSELEGYQGAYNKLDQELLLKAIINRLDIILSDLEQIKYNQRMLYDMLLEANRNINTMINQINASNDKIVEILDDNRKAIAVHQSAAEYTERNTRYLLDLESYKYWSR